MTAALIAAIAGAALGIWVTWRLHKGHGPWSKRLGHTRFRYANVPVGGMLSLPPAVILALVGVTGVAAVILAAGAGMAVTAIAGRFVDPLAPFGLSPHALSAWQQRGPWWWRLRCWLSRLLGRAACTVEPDDRRSTSWHSADGNRIYIATIRRRA
jgi:hypothetical protein